MLLVLIEVPLFLIIQQPNQLVPELTKYQILKGYYDKDGA